MSSAYQRATDRMDAAVRAATSGDPTKVFPMTHKSDSERLIEVADGVKLTPIEFFAVGSIAKESLVTLREAGEKLSAFIADAMAPITGQEGYVDPDIAPALQAVSENINTFTDRVDRRYATQAIREQIGLQEIAASNARLTVVGHLNMRASEGASLAQATAKLLADAISTLAGARKRALHNLAECETRQLKAQIVDFLKRAAAGDREHDIDELDIHSLHKACDDWIDFHAAGAAGDGHHEQLAAVLAHCFRLATGKTVDPA